MPISANFDIDGMFEGIYRMFDEALVESIIEAMRLACLDTVSDAKQLDTYKDRTGNLRSSIGYGIYDNGEKVEDYFQANPVAAGVIKEEYKHKTEEGVKTGVREVEIGGDGEDGVKGGRELVEDIAKGFPNGVVAIVVAGVDYALWVEGNGKDVISGPCLRLKALLENNFQKIRDVYKNG
jgi:hypothetical protein